MHTNKQQTLHLAKLAFPASASDLFSFTENFLETFYFLLPPVHISLSKKAMTQAFIAVMKMLSSKSASDFL